MDYIFWGVCLFLYSLICFVVGYMTATREAGKEIRVLKDCSERQKNTIVAYMDEVDQLQRKARG